MNYKTTVICTDTHLRDVDLLDLQIVQNISHGLQNHEFTSANILLFLESQSAQNITASRKDTYLDVVVDDLKKTSPSV